MRHERLPMPTDRQIAFAAEDMACMAWGSVTDVIREHPNPEPPVPKPRRLIADVDALDLISAVLVADPADVYDRVSDLVAMTGRAV